jgi:hypothetical protein
MVHAWVSVSSAAMSAGYLITYKVIESDSVRLPALWLAVSMLFWMLGVAIVSYFGESEQASQPNYAWMAKITGPMRRSVWCLSATTIVGLQLITVYNM